MHEATSAEQERYHVGDLLSVHSVAVSGVCGRKFAESGTEYWNHVAGGDEQSRWILLQLVRSRRIAAGTNQTTIQTRFSHVRLGSLTVSTSCLQVVFSLQR